MQTSPFNPDDDRRILAAIIESSDDAIIAKNLNGIILSWNLGAERITVIPQAKRSDIQSPS